MPHAAIVVASVEIFLVPRILLVRGELTSGYPERGEALLLPSGESIALISLSHGACSGLGVSLAMPVCEAVERLRPGDLLVSASSAP